MLRYRSPIWLQAEIGGTGTQFGDCPQPIIGGMSDDIMFNDLLHLTDEEIGSTKIRFIMHFSKSDPIYVFMNNPDELNTEWLLSRKKSNNGKDAEHLHKGENVIGLVRLPDDKDLWLFTCIKHISGPLDRPREDNGTDYYVGYEGEELAEYRKFYGRVIVRYHKGKGQQGSIRWAEGLLDKIHVVKVLSDTYAGDEFPGYDCVSLSYAQLKTIWDKDKSSWKSTLSRQQGVYVITDTATGNLYVGNATGRNGIYQRWQDYIRDGHGNDTRLIAIVEQYGLEYVQTHFRYTLLEHYDFTVPKDVVLARESYWKEALDTRKHGYNDN